MASKKEVRMDSQPHRLPTFFPCRICVGKIFLHLIDKSRCLRIQLLSGRVTESCKKITNISTSRHGNYAIVCVADRCGIQWEGSKATFLAYIEPMVGCTLLLDQDWCQTNYTLTSSIITRNCIIRSNEIHNTKQATWADPNQAEERGCPDAQMTLC